MHYTAVRKFLALALKPKTETNDAADVWLEASLYILIRKRPCLATQNLEPNLTLFQTQTVLLTAHMSRFVKKCFTC